MRVLIDGLNRDIFHYVRRLGQHSRLLTFGKSSYHYCLLAHHLRLAPLAEYTIIPVTAESTDEFQKHRTRQHLGK